VPPHVRALLGPSWLIEGEDAALYEDLLAQVGAAVQPLDMIDWLLVKDVVALTWEIHRSRNLRDFVVRQASEAAMSRLLQSAYPRDPVGPGAGRDMAIKLLVGRWRKGEKAAIKDIEAKLANAGLSMSDLSLQALSLKAEELDRIDEQTRRHEDRRDKILQQIERRRSGWSKMVERASEEVVDVEFRDATPPGAGEDVAAS